MKKTAIFVLFLGLFLFVPSIYAQQETPEAGAPEPADTAAPQAKEEAATENLEFVSGEVTAADASAKSLTVKLYGENEATSGKTLTVQVTETTDITDGEKDRDFTGLAAGTEVDVEYDPATSKATYIFIY